MEWTNQHGCGGDEDSDPHKLNCNIVLQYMCQPGDETNNSKFLTLWIQVDLITSRVFLLLAALNRDTIRNGVQRATQEYAAPPNQPSASNDNTRRTNRVQLNRGLHESFDWYDACYNRPRNYGWYPCSIRISFTDVICVQVCSLLIKYYVRIQPFTHVKIQTVIAVVTNVQKRETTTPTGTPHRGGILPF